MSLLQMSLSGGAMILAAALVRALTLHRLPKRFFVILWALVLSRLLMPFSLPAACSVYSLFNKQSTASQPISAHTVTGLPPTALAQETTELASGPAELSPVSVDPWVILWLVGFIACAAYFTMVYVKCRREFREALPVQDAFAVEWLAAHRLRRSITLRQSDKITAPLTYGVLRPVILLPKSTDWADRETLNYALTHEWIHIRRFDGVFKLCLTAALCVHWFNPLVWLMAAFANQDIELACDEVVLRLSGWGARAGYALALLRMEEHRSGLPVIGSHFSKNSLEERIKAMMKIKKTSLAALLTAVVFLGGMGAVFATSAQAKEQDVAPGSYYTAEKQEADILIRNDLAGGTSYSTDGGETWTPMTDEEFSKVYSSPDVEWWTAEEYAAWLENEKKELQTIIGSRGWTPSTGWFTWTQEMVDETIVRYEEILAMIEDGYLVSKFVDGSYDPMDSLVRLEEFEPDQMFLDALDSQQYASAELQSDAENTGRKLERYKEFGLAYSFDPNQATGQLRMTWNGQPVRSLFDPERQLWVCNSLGTEGLNLEAVYENGRLTGVKAVVD